MLYLFLKSLHVTAAIVWIGALFLFAFVTITPGLDADRIKSVRRVTEAGIGATWLAGLVLVLLGSWYTSAWWQIKVVLVIVISAIHTVMHSRWQRQNGEVLQTHWMVPVAILCLTLIVVLLAISKIPY